jgi:integrase
MGDMSDRPGAASVLLTVLKVVLSQAVRLGWVENNPAREVAGYKSSEYHTLTEDEIAQFEARWPLGTRERLAFDTMLYTGQRCSDACRMPVPDAQGKMRFEQEKTKRSAGGSRMVIRAHRELQESIAAHGVHGALINLNHWGRPYSANRFGQFVSNAMRMAGLSNVCVPHGLRKAAARRLAEVGCSPHEIMSLTGHKTLAEVERYTRAVEQERLNEQATAKLEAMT